MIVLIILALISLTILFWQVSHIVSIISGCPYVKSDVVVVQKALKLARLKKGEIFYDLGSGKGEVLIAAAKLGAKCTGYEISPYYYIYSSIRILLIKLYTQIRSSVNRVTNDKNIPVIYIKHRNIRNVDLAKPDVVYCYLIPEFLKKLAPKFKKEMKKGSRLISLGFPIPGLKNEKKYNINHRTFFIYSF